VVGNGPNGDGGGTRLIVNGAQVYDWGALESNYTGSFTYLAIAGVSDDIDDDIGIDFGRLTDFFTNPIVRVTNGKISINLDEPVNGLVSVKVFEKYYKFGDDITISDPTTKIFWIVSGWNENYDGYLELIVWNTNCGTYSTKIIYADKPVTITGNWEYDCNYDDKRNKYNCSNYPYSLNLQRGWNAVSVLDDDGVDDNRPPFINTTDLSGSGYIKWMIWSDFDPVVPPPTTTPIPLAGNIWANGSITSTAFGSTAWYSFNVERGETYYVWWNDKGWYGNNGDGSKTLFILVSAIYSGGPSILINEEERGGGHDNGGYYGKASFTADRNGTVQVRVTPYWFGYTGTFAVAYSTSDTRPGSSGLNKSGVGPDYKSDVLSRQKRLKERSNSLFKRF
jgi:hypothetical protein